MPTVGKVNKSDKKVNGYLDKHLLIQFSLKTVFTC